LGPSSVNALLLLEGKCEDKKARGRHTMTWIDICCNRHQKTNSLSWSKKTGRGTVVVVEKETQQLS